MNDEQKTKIRAQLVAGERNLWDLAASIGIPREDIRDVQNYLSKLGLGSSQPTGLVYGDFEESPGTAAPDAGVPRTAKTTPRDATDFQPNLAGAVYHHCKAPFQRYVISDQRAVYYLTGDKAGKPVIPRSRDVWQQREDKWRPHPELFVQLYDDKGKRREMSVEFLYRNCGRKVETKKKTAPKVKGKRGRPGKVDAAQVQRLRGQGKTVRDIAGILGVGLATIARVPKCSEIKEGYITLNNSNFGTEYKA